jgi:hypothetical protein
MNFTEICKCGLLSNILYIHDSCLLKDSTRKNPWIAAKETSVHIESATFNGMCELTYKGYHA